MDQNRVEKTITFLERSMMRKTLTFVAIGCKGEFKLAVGTAEGQKIW